MKRGNYKNIVLFIPVILLFALVASDENTYYSKEILIKEKNPLAEGELTVWKKKFILGDWRPHSVQFSYLGKAKNSSIYTNSKVYSFEHSQNLIAVIDSVQWLDKIASEPEIIIYSTTENNQMRMDTLVYKNYNTVQK